MVVTQEVSGVRCLRFRLKAGNRGEVAVKHRRAHTISLTALSASLATFLATTSAILPAPAHADVAPTAIDAYGGTEMAQAIQTGTPIVVDSQTTETSQVTAEPDGQFQLVSSRGPVRAMT